MRWCPSLFATGLLIVSAPVAAGQKLTNDPARCRGDQPAVLAIVNGVKASTGTMRVQSYRATKADWLAKGRWLNRIETSARAGVMTFCIPVAEPGTYAIAIRHDVNGNGETDFTKDGAGMSNNPAVSILNLGKPSYSRVGVRVTGPTRITINMRYM